jgi:hypothetical protein
MRKETLAFTFCLFTITSIFAQEKFNTEPNKERKGFASINIGLNAPTGNYGSDDFDNSEAAYAKTGAMFDVTFGYKILPNLGLTAMWRNQANSIDTDKYKEDFENYLDNNTNAFYPRADINAGSFKLNGFMAGIYTTFPISKKTNFDTRLLFGYSLATSPSFSTVVYEYGTKSLTIDREKAETGAFSFIIGAGLKKALSEKIYFMFNIDFYSTNAEWKNVKETIYSYRTGFYNSGKYEMSQKTNTLNISLGIGKRF